MRPRRQAPGSTPSSSSTTTSSSISVSPTATDTDTSTHSTASSSDTSLTSSSSSTTSLSDATQSSSTTESTSSLPTSLMITTTSQATGNTSLTSTISPVSSTSTQPAPLLPASTAAEDTTSTGSSSSGTAPTTTASYTTIVTNVGGKSTTITSQLPTSLVAPSLPDSDSRRTVTIAGATSGVFAFIVIILAAVYAYRKHALRNRQNASGQRREGHGLLDGEEFDDDDIATHMRQTSSYRNSFSRTTSPVPSLLKSRVAGSGSIFREEVWPPPGFVDPISKNNSQVDLGKIVDEVMGPMTPGHERDLTDATTFSTLSATTTNTVTPLLAGEHGRRSLSNTSHDDPFSTSNSQASFYGPVYYSLPPGASPPTQPGMPQPIPSSSEASSSQLYGSGNSLHSMPASIPTPGVSSLGQLAPPRIVSGSTLPKKSSPLARALTQDQKLLSHAQDAQDPFEHSTS